MENVEKAADENDGGRSLAAGIYRRLLLFSSACFGLFDRAVGGSNPTVQGGLDFIERSAAAEAIESLRELTATEPIEVEISGRFQIKFIGKRS